jgi:hypothetical protein
VIRVSLQAVIQRLTAKAVQILTAMEDPTPMEIGMSMMALTHSFQTSRNGLMKMVMGLETTTMEPLRIHVFQKLEVRRSAHTTILQLANGAT